jgi:hypothetical protein
MMPSRFHATKWATALALSAATAAIPAIAQSTAAAPLQKASPRGSIKVSGYWKIDVRNTDGSLASHTEFENSLAFTGGDLLAEVLAGRLAIGTLFVELDGSQHPCGNQPCWIIPNNPLLLGPGSPFNSPNVFPKLNVTAQQIAPPSLLLNGLATTDGGTINVVRTRVILACRAAPAPCDIPGGFSLPIGELTEFTLATPINVTTGQVVNVSVTLSFSS